MSIPPDAIAAIRGFNRFYNYASAAPFRPTDAIGLLVDAAKGGSGDAAALVSVIAGGGLHAPQNWDAGLEYLTLAARHGQSAAQQQLRLLAGSPEHKWEGVRLSTAQADVIF